jgi:acyl-coenzyme A synthetase/AMP-(fatty) acid ligase
VSPAGAPGAIAIVDPERTWLQDELAGDVLGLRAQCETGGSVALHTTRACVIAAALESLDGWAAAVHLLPPDLDDDPPRGVPVLDEPQPLDAAAPPTPVLPALETRWVLYTSGTTGTPRPVAHTMASLTRTVTTGKRARDLTWGLLYDPNRMAGLQVLLQARATSTPVAAPELSTPLSARIDWLRAAGVDALSATPTLWRLILQSPASGGWPLRQITLGGEIADQRILDALAQAFPGSHVTHVFASTETGAAFAVGDGRAGFPLAYLTEPPRGIALDIRDDTLYVASPGLSTAGPDGFASTEDEVEVTGDRVLFKGRRSGVVNVGGAKVWPEEVEALLRTHPEVGDAIVTAKANPFSGSILTARVVPAAGAGDDLGRRLRTWLRERAPVHHVPATVAVVDALPVSDAGKAERR